MPKAGLFAGEVVKPAPADKSPTTKQEGYQWMEYAVNVPVPQPQPCSGKYIEALNPTQQAYSKPELWAGSGNQFTIAGFYQVPDWQVNGGTFLKSTYFDCAFRYWYTGFRECRFDIDLYTPLYAQNFRLETEILYPYLIIGEWFCLMYSIDTSVVGEPTKSAWLHKVGQSSAINLFTNANRDEWDAGPSPAFEFDDPTAVHVIGNHPDDPNRGQNFNQGNVIITNEYVNWDDPANRAKIVDPNTGKPVGLGNNGQLLTGNPAMIYLPDGNGTINWGTAGDFSEVNGPIEDADTSACDSVPSTKVWALTRSDSPFRYVEIDYASENQVVLAELPISIQTGSEASFSDGKYVITQNGAGNQLYCYKWDGAAFIETTNLPNASYNNVRGTFGTPDGAWISCGSGPFTDGVTTGTWSPNAITVGVHKFYDYDHISYWAMDFRSSGSGIGDYDGYGDFYATISAEGTCTWSLVDNGATPADVHSTIPTMNIPYPTVGCQGWDRATGDYCIVFGENVKYGKVNLTSKELVYQGEIVLTGNATALCTFKFGYLITVGTDRIIRTFSLSGLTATEVDNYDANALINTFPASGQYNIHQDPYSNKIIFPFGRIGSSGFVFEIDRDGMFLDNVHELFGFQCGLGANKMFFLPAPLEVTP